jgi:membrane fusion protein, multidrug efflux system
MIKPFLKHSIQLILAVVIIASCQNSSTEEDLREDLVKYQNKLEEIQEKIKNIEAELVTMEDTVEGRPRGIVKAVRVEKVEKRPFSHYIDVHGSANSPENVLIHSEINANVTRIPVTEGQAVKEGELLVRLDSERIEQSIKEVETSLELATTLYKRQKNLWDRNIGSEIEYLQARNNKLSLEQNLNTLKTQLRQTQIKSPINGYVDQININRGELASPGMPIIRVVNLDKIKIEADVSERYIGKIKAGDSVSVRIPALNLNKRTLIHHVSRVLDPGNRTFKIQIQMDNPEHLIKPNLMAVIRFSDYSVDNAIVIPSEALQYNRGQHYVYVAEEVRGFTISKAVEVEKGMTYRDKSEITSGLNGGEQVITIGYHDISDGSPVEIIK